MRPLAWLLAALAVVPGVVRASTPEGREETGLGFVVGPVAGIGFTWRTFREDGSGLQVGGLATADAGDATVILGLQGMHTLRVRPRSRLYALAGLMHIYERRQDSSTNAGGGIGMSFGSSEGVTAALELPLVLHFRAGRLDGVAPIPQLSLVYNY